MKNEACGGRLRSDIFCYSLQHADPVDCYRLTLINTRLSGSLPESNRPPALPQVSLDIQNQVTGNCARNLQTCGFNGSILLFLALNGNFLDGRIPPTVGELPVISFDGTGFDNLTVLRHMHLNNNNLSGAIPTALSTTPKLFHLYIFIRFYESPLLMISVLFAFVTDCWKTTTFQEPYLQKSAACHS
ncbi:hypothetical protein SELMODRAFT_406711 [Selaginella moellendorffii]|uniref:Leucine-rich repeat-containing N-terminal plant-type domain-containing protein n=1 Tax=Selaginella moellendorffii TaxID=88036 RepID=D8R180_SELML|nr:hypothetical protein SELMODRAFT_406711 [Selaginella moellendorffii]